MLLHHQSKLTVRGNTVNTVYDIFRDFPDSGPIWMEAVQGLENVMGRLRILVQTRPGDYFVYDSTSAKVIDTTTKSV
jgi:hypothetical protein